MQCISDSWRITFGSMAITIINNVFESNTEDFSNNEAYIHFAQQQLNTLQFLYGDVTAKVHRTYISATDTNLIYLAILPSSSRTSHSSHSHSSILSNSRHDQSTFPWRCQTPFKLTIWCFGHVCCSSIFFLLISNMILTRF